MAERIILKTKECPSLSGKSTLTHRIGSNNDNNVHVALTCNSGGGHLNSDWVSLEEIYSILSSLKKPVTSGALQELLQSKSSNTSGFITATLLAEGILKVSPGNRHYELVGQVALKKIFQGLIETAPEEKPAKKKTGKKRKEVSNDRANHTGFDNWCSAFDAFPNDQEPGHTGHRGSGVHVSTSSFGRSTDHSNCFCLQKSIF